ncbi:mRNA 3'-end processing factor [Shinella sp. SUS2]|uniref:MBL fold metallo-hydrolase RNA specificity domain-containing protein n=1 Tax=unclassified Shinella TaxID=2643062 RepID=UPI00068101F0|nr:MULTISPECIES: MBL fold metallo-hydrolase [unclassified Shinella]ANH08790.1 mRNA 3'-end processing factor [Shinella sp. HZN7]KNY12890.1 mRNA 3'-end processing factor [Shinella sp. SUS2]KOC71480.1 mRNA 3'-end processing factor [Shinella sp. GWS1]MDG4676129.1 MBL fold metallo-hydrolase [Shinella sp. 838]
MLKLKSLGAAGTVTGAKHLLEFDSHRILIDCGLFQGLKNLREQNWEPLPVPPRDIDAVILTHAHLDHSGYLPRLVRDGFRGKIYATEATRDVAELILKDSAFLQEKDADFLNQHHLSKHQPALPLYGIRDAQRALEHFTTVDFNEVIELRNGVSLQFRHAGHILGAANAEIQWGGTRMMFSGDIGRYGDPLFPDPVSGGNVDYIMVESTYGNRVHSDEDPAEALATVAERTIKRGGTLIIPAFAVGRAQELLYHFWKLKSAGRLGSVPIFLDSPMAIDATELMSRHSQHHRLDHETCRKAFGIARYTDDVEASKAITANPFPKIVISASGMATGGRVLHHLKTFGPDPKNTILLSGFQAMGTRGHALQQGAKELKIHGMWVPINAEVAQIGMLSAHADSNELMRWLSGFNEPKRVFIVHGEPDASEALRVRIKRELGWSSVVPRQDQEFQL